MSDNQSEPKHVVRIKKLKSLLAMVDNAVKTDNYLFRNVYADIDGVEKDILKDGMLSCSVFASAILLNLELIKKPHTTVSGSEKDMHESGWHEISEPRPGAVIIWEKKVFDDGQEHRHLGFCVGPDEAISNSSTEGFPRRHHITFNGTRHFEKIYWHSDLDQG